jgi:ArsR family transcriptional regulator, lead/cadmium/zinc/bismuth-responsive transcriptional repressor
MFNKKRKGKPPRAGAGDRAAELADLFRLLGDGSRLRIVLACIAGPSTVGRIAEQLDLSPSLVSHHLRLLRAARVVRAERQGRHVSYGAADDHIRCVIDDMLAHLAEPHNRVEIE